LYRVEYSYNLSLFAEAFVGIGAAFRREWDTQTLDAQLSGWIGGRIIGSWSMGLAGQIEFPCAADLQVRPVCANVNVRIAGEIGFEMSVTLQGEGFWENWGINFNRTLGAVWGVQATAGALVRFDLTNSFTATNPRITSFQVSGINQYVRFCLPSIGCYTINL
jgi:hypothetical protein